jgi:hypothetical protein
MGQINTDECVILEVRQCTINVTSRFACATIVVVDKRIIITYSECVFVDVGIHHVMHMRSLAICGLSSCTICFSRYLHHFRKKIFFEQEMCFDFLYNFCPKHFSF